MKTYKEFINEENRNHWIIVDISRAEAGKLSSDDIQKWIDNQDMITIDHFYYKNPRYNSGPADIIFMPMLDPNRIPVSMQDKFVKEFKKYVLSNSIRKANR